jgi:RHS repeat-associated protein
MAVGTSTFVYDAGGSRAKKTEGGQTIIYVNKYYEKNITTGEVTTYYYLGAKMVAQRKNTTLQYMHQDHLTGTSLVTNADGSQNSTIKYVPFGATLSGSVPTDIKFTGQRLDATGLYYYGARYYDATIGRFISPDPTIPNPADPQAFNRYTYCSNNPLKYIDPSGHDPEDDPWQYSWSDFQKTPSEPTTPSGDVAACHAVWKGAGEALIDFTLNLITFGKYSELTTRESLRNGMTVDDYGKGLVNRFDVSKPENLSYGITMGGLIYGSGKIIGGLAGELPEIKGISGISENQAVRYVNGAELAEIKANGGYLPFTDIEGRPKDVWATTNFYSKVSEVENNLKVGSQDPRGEFPSPEYGVVFGKDSVSWKVDHTLGTGAKELITDQTLTQKISIDYYFKLNK